MLQKNVTSHWCMTSNVLKNKICDCFFDIALFFKNEAFIIIFSVEVVITNLYFGKLEHFLKSDTFRKLCIPLE